MAEQKGISDGEDEAGVIAEKVDAVLKGSFILDYRLLCSTTFIFVVLLWLLSFFPIQ
jgi:hypothetical protein